MNRLVLALFLLISSASIAQSFSGQSAGDIFIIPPYRACFGPDNGKNACLAQTGNTIARFSGHLDFALVEKTVATLPPAAQNIDRLFRVTDGNLPGDCTVGGGTSPALCMSNGTSWVSSGTLGGGCGGTCLLIPAGAGIIVANGVDGNTTNASTADVNGALGFSAANDANVVHKTGVETVAGAKTFSDNAVFNGNINIFGTLNFVQPGPFLAQGVKQTGTPTVGASYDYGAYVDSASIFRCLLFSGTSCALGISPIYLNAGTPTSQTNECPAITNDSAGSTTVTAIAVARWIAAGGVAHDVLCLITVDAANPSLVGSLVFPGSVGFSSNSSPSQGAGAIESLRSTGGLIALTNNGGTNRTNSINMRACNGPGATNCGTDLLFIEDSTGTGKEEWEFLPGGSASSIYIGGLGSAHPGVFFGGNVARTNAPFGFDGPSFGNLTHLLRLAADGDIWNPATLSSGTVTVNFQRNHTGTAKPLCYVTWQGTGTLTGILKCVVNGSAGAWTGITITSTAAPAIIGGGTVAMPTGALTTNTCASAVTALTTGTQSSDTIQWSYNAAPGSPNGLLTITPYPTTNNANFLQCNPTSATQTPVGATLTFLVMRSSTASSDTAVVSYLVVGDAF